MPTQSNVCVDRNGKFLRPERLGVGLQYNPELVDWFPFSELSVAVLEVLLDACMGPLDSPYLFLPGALDSLKQAATKTRLLAHSNYGCDFGFSPLESTPAVKRHVPLARAINSPWVANHCFYGDSSWSDIWSSPLQFSQAEVRRVASRAARLQELYGIPFAHENAAYYFPTPGAEMHEAEFLARMIEQSGTFLHLDLHNVYANSINLPDFDTIDYLTTIPLDRVISVHLGGGSWYDGAYHDWHDGPIPEPVWDLLEWLLNRAEPSAVILEFQGRAHHPATRQLDAHSDEDMIISSLDRAKRVWAKHCPGLL